MEYKRLPDINGWAALRAVVEQGGVNPVSRSLSVGQPAITKRIRALEYCYGVALFEKHGRSLTLTTAGELVYQFAVETLDKQAALEESLQLLSRGQHQLRLEMSLSIGEYFLSNWLVDFARIHPDYKVRSRLGYGRDIEARLSRGIVDVAILEAPPEHTDILVQRWKEDELWLVCGPNHPLAATDMISIDRIRAGRYVLRELRSSLREHLDNALRSIGIEQVNCVLEAGSDKSIVEILLKDDLLSFLPKFVLQDLVETGKVHRIKVKGFRIMRTLWIARRKDRLDHTPSDAFIKMLSIPLNSIESHITE